MMMMMTTTKTMMDDDDQDADDDDDDDDDAQRLTRHRRTLSLSQLKLYCQADAFLAESSGSGSQACLMDQALRKLPKAVLRRNGRKSQ